MKKIYICTRVALSPSTPSCGTRNSKKTLALLCEEAAKHHLPIDIEEITCLGHCQDGPSLRIAGGNFFLGATPEKVPEILSWLEKELSE